MKLLVSEITGEYQDYPQKYKKNPYLGKRSHVNRNKKVRELVVIAAKKGMQ